MGVLPFRVFQISVISPTRIRLPFRENQTGLTAPPENSAKTEMGSFLSVSISAIIVSICSLVKWRKGFPRPGCNDRENHSFDLYLDTIKGEKRLAFGLNGVS